MASKLFSRTKSDRHSYRVDGFIPVDQYPNGPTDLTLSKRRKKKQRPNPLQLQTRNNTFDASYFAPETVTKPMDDTLFSPTTMSSPAWNLNAGRPRSHTAPPTPAIAELPGSILLENQGFPENAVSGQQDSLTSPFQLPASIPSVSLHKKSWSMNTATSRWVGPRPRSSGTQSLRTRRPSLNSKFSFHRDVLGRRGDQSDSGSLMRSPITEVTETPGLVDNAPPNKHEMRAPQVSESEQLKATIAAQDKRMMMLKSQFKHLRISHDAHVASMAETHRREVDALKAYVHCIEESQEGRPPNSLITIPAKELRGPTPELQMAQESDDSSQAADKKEGTRWEPHGSVPGLWVHPSMRSPCRSRAASITSGEGPEKVEELKKKLEQANQHIGTMKDQMDMVVARKDVYKNRAADLEARASNDHELLVDLRESEYKLEMERRTMHEQHRQLKAELDVLRAKPEQSKVSRMEKQLREQLQRANLLAAQLETAEMRTPVPNVVAELSGTIDDLKERLHERDEQVYELQHVNKALRLDLEELETQQARYAAQHDEALAQEARKRKAIKDKMGRVEAENKEFKEVMEAQGRDMLTVQEEYERLRKLLHSEMRSQAKEAISRNLIPGTPSSADGYLELVAAEARRRVKTLIAKEHEQSPHEPYTDPHVRIEQLERELQYHVNELIRSKRDNRSFRKDIKRATTKLDKFRTSQLPASDVSPKSHGRQPSLQDPITPAQSPEREKQSASGLGISTTTPSPSSQPGSTSDSPLHPRTPGRSNPQKQLPRYPKLPEQNLANIPPPTRDPPALPPPSREPPLPPPSQGQQQQQQQQQPQTPVYKLTPSIARTSSLARTSIASTQAMPRSPAKRPPHQRYYTTTCIVSAAACTSSPSSAPRPSRSSSSRPAPPTSPAPSLPKRAATLTTKRPNPYLVAHNPTAPVPDTPWPGAGPVERPRTAGAGAARSAAPVPDSAAITALPQRPSTGSWKAEVRSQEERLGLVVRKQRSVEGLGLQGLLMRRKKSTASGGASLRRAVTSGGGGGSLRGRPAAVVGGDGQVVVPVVMGGR